jgi:hypothetical protein
MLPKCQVTPPLHDSLFRRFLDAAIASRGLEVANISETRPLPLLTSRIACELPYVSFTD